jgi:hypothetical protein
MTASTSPSSDAITPARRPLNTNDLGDLITSLSSLATTLRDVQSTQLQQGMRIEEQGRRIEEILKRDHK